MIKFFCDKCLKEAIDKAPCKCETTYHRERLNPEDIKPFDGILSPDWIVNLVNVCDSPNSDNK